MFITINVSLNKIWRTRGGGSPSTPHCMLAEALWISHLLMLMTWLFGYEGCLWILSCYVEVRAPRLTELLRIPSPCIDLSRYFERFSQLEAARRQDPEYQRQIQERDEKVAKLRKLMTPEQIAQCFPFEARADAAVDKAEE